jgi:hypothetical protein
VLKRKLCEAAFHWELNCAGPLLIADGRYPQEKVKEPFKGDKKRQGWYPDKFFINKTGEEEMIQLVRAVNFPPPHNWGFYVPGTSLRGPFRAQAERILHSLISKEESPETACDPFEQDKNNRGKPLLGCSTRWEKNNGAEGRNPYKEACPACKLFGFAGLASRISFADADINQGYRSVYRDMIGIDRFTGGVFTQDGGGGANMRFHVLENLSFTTTVTVINFELWQLGLFEALLAQGYHLVRYADDFVILAKTRAEAQAAPRPWSICGSSSKPAPIGGTAPMRPIGFKGCPGKRESMPRSLIAAPRPWPISWKNTAKGPRQPRCWPSRPPHLGART